MTKKIVYSLRMHESRNGYMIADLRLAVRDDSDKRYDQTSEEFFNDKMWYDEGFSFRYQSTQLKRAANGRYYEAFPSSLFDDEPKEQQRAQFMPYGITEKHWSHWYAGKLDVADCVTISERGVDEIKKLAYILNRINKAKVKYNLSYKYSDDMLAIIIATLNRIGAINIVRETYHIDTSYFQ